MKQNDRGRTDDQRHKMLTGQSSFNGQVRDDKLLSAIHTAAAEFINRESNRRSLVTVTKVAALDEKHVQIYVSVFPQKDARAVIDFLSRQHKEFLAFLKKTVKLHTIPQMNFILDPEMGEIHNTTLQ